MSIYDHDFDGVISICCYNSIDGKPLFVQLDTGCDCLDLYKKDVIVLAKHFGLEIKEVEE